MGGFFRIDGGFYRLGSMVFDMIVLSMLWLICSIPIVTAGAATTAVFYVTTRKVSGKEKYLVSDFFKSFRNNFVQSTLSWLIILFILILVSINMLYCIRAGNTLLLAGQFFIAIELFLIWIYLFPIISRFDMKFFMAFKSAFFMANRHVLTSVTCLALVLASLYLSLTSIIYSFIGMGAYAYLASYMLVRVFRKYRPEMDNDIIEDRPLNIKVEEEGNDTP